MAIIEGEVPKHQRFMESGIDYCAIGQEEFLFPKQTGQSEKLRIKQPPTLTF